MLYFVALVSKTCSDSAILVGRIRELWTLQVYVSWLSKPSVFGPHHSETISIRRLTPRALDA